MQLIKNQWQAFTSGLVALYTVICLCGKALTQPKFWYAILYLALFMSVEVCGIFLIEHLNSPGRFNNYEVVAMLFYLIIGLPWLMGHTIKIIKYLGGLQNDK